MEVGASVDFGVLLIKFSASNPGEPDNKLRKFGGNPGSFISVFKDTKIISLRFLMRMRLRRYFIDLSLQGVKVLFNYFNISFGGCHFLLTFVSPLKKGYCFLKFWD